MPAVIIGTGLREVMRERRAGLGMTQAQLGESDRVGQRISTTTIKKIENGRSTAARANNLAVLLLRLKMTPDDLAEIDGGYPQVGHMMERLARQAGPPDRFSWRAFHEGE